LSEKGKIYFVSDVHLGAPALKDNREREILFAGWLDMIRSDVKELYLMGDIFDFWFEYKKVVPRGFNRVLGRIADMTDSGIPVWFFPGNHDLWISDYFPEELGITVVKDGLVKEIEGKKFFLAHGDGLDAGDKGYLLLKKVFTNKTMHWLFSRLHPNFALWLAHGWSKSSRLSKMGLEEDFVEENEGMFQFAKSYLNNEFIDYFIFGHRHRMVKTKLSENSNFVILGDWINNFSYGVYNGDKFELKIYKEQRKAKK